jgi:hypothetical protein
VRYQQAAVTVGNNQKRKAPTQVGAENARFSKIPYHLLKGSTKSKELLERTLSLVGFFF